MDYLKKSGNKKYIFTSCQTAFSTDIFYLINWKSNFKLNKEFFISRLVIYNSMEFLGGKIAIIEIKYKWKAGNERQVYNKV